VRGREGPCCGSRPAHRSDWRLSPLTGRRGETGWTPSRPQRTRRLATMAGVVALLLPVPAVGASAAGATRQVQVLDDCDPATFNAAIGPGTCVKDGGTTFSEFIAQLLAQGRPPPGVLPPPSSTSASSDRNTSSKARQNFASRLRRPDRAHDVGASRAGRGGVTVPNPRLHEPVAHKRPSSFRTPHAIARFHAAERDRGGRTTRTVTALIQRGAQASGPAMAPPSRTPPRPATPGRRPAGGPRSAARRAGRPR
jgi:hypothetical protein